MLPKCENPAVRLELAKCSHYQEGSARIPKDTPDVTDTCRRAIECRKQPPTDLRK